jgi:uncharacterized damage-inducible protein DinB
MDMLDRYLGYETWTLRYFITRCRNVTPSQLHQPFDIGHGMVHATFEHLISNIEVWTDLMRERSVRHLPPLAATPDSYLQRFDDAMTDFAECARRLVAEDRLDETYVDVLDSPPKPKTFGGTLLHVLTHTTVHRWEIQHMLQRLGLPDLIEGDALSWETKHRLA